MEGREFSGLSICRVLRARETPSLTAMRGEGHAGPVLLLLLLFCITENNENQNKSEGSITCGLG